MSISSTCETTLSIFPASSACKLAAFAVAIALNASLTSIVSFAASAVLFNSATAILKAVAASDAL